MGLDAAIAVLLLLAFYRGFRQGFIMAVFSLAAYAVGFFFTMRLSFLTASYLDANFQISSQWLPLIAFVVTFALLVLAVRLLGKLVESLVNKILPSVFNRLLGGLLYVVVAVVLAGAFFLLMDGTGLFQPGFTETSVAAPWLNRVGLLVQEQMGSVLPAIRELFSLARNYFENLGDYLPEP